MTTCLAVMSNAPPEVLARTLASAAPFVSQAVIVVAPGHRHLVPDSPVRTRVMEIPWTNHAEMRTMTQAVAVEDPMVTWVLMLDAGMTVHGTLPTGLEADAYEVAIEDPVSRWRWMRSGHLQQARLGVRWKGTGGTGLHEMMVPPAGAMVKPWPKLVLRGSSSPKTGARTYERDAEAFRLALERDPSDARTAFYFAQSLKDAGKFREACDAFARRASMPGWAEETFWAKLWAGKCCMVLGLPRDASAWAQRAADDYPRRAEPLILAAQAMRAIGDEPEALRLAKQAFHLEYPIAARMFIDTTAYSKAALREAGVEVQR